MTKILESMQLIVLLGLICIAWWRLTSAAYKIQANMLDRYPILDEKVKYWLFESGVCLGIVILWVLIN